MKSKLIWQTGKSAWGAYNVGAAVYRMRHQFLMNEDDIADAAMKSNRDIKDMLRAYKCIQNMLNLAAMKILLDFLSFSRKHLLVSRRWVSASDENKEMYFSWIKPGDGQRIRSVATRGGLRDFKDVIGNDVALESFISDENLTC